MKHARPDRADHLAATEMWSSILQELALQIRREQLQTWFLRVAALAFDGQTLQLAVPSNFHRSWILENYGDALREAAERTVGIALQLDLVVDPEKASTALPPAAFSTNPPASAAGAAPGAPGAAPSSAAAEPERSDVPESPRRAAAWPRSANHGSGNSGLSSSGIGAHGFSDGGASTLGSDDALDPLTLNPAYTFSNFVVGPCNRFAYAGAMGVAENPARAYNPLFLHGSVGLGKTHLLQAICHDLLRRKPSTRILYLSCETFTNHFIAALEKGALENFRRRYRNVDVLVVDDIHFLANKERTQEEFFHTFNALFQASRQIVLSSDSPAKEIPTLQERLVSRFKWGLEAEIEKPCFETRLAILRRKARTMNVTLADEVAMVLAERITNNIRELEGAINRIVGYSSLQNEKITPELVKRVMPELEADKTTIVRMEDISSIVARIYHVRLQDLQSRRRHQSVALPRQLAMFLARRHTKHSLEEIGGYFGGRDHTTVLYAVEKIDSLLTTDTALRDTVSKIAEELVRSYSRPTS